MKVKYWGTRGSFPSPLTPEIIEARIMNRNSKSFDPSQRHEFGGYGGDTTCIEVTAKFGQQVIIDAGSGIRRLGYEMLKGPAGRGKAQIHILFTHFHWDHIIGLLFFTPIFVPGNEIFVYAVQPEIHEIFELMFRKPYFPVELENLGSKIKIKQITARRAFNIGDIKVTPYQLDHPDPCWGYKVEADGKAYAHCVDTECTRMTQDALGADLPLYQGVDLMTFDGQYTLMESVEKVNWGHAAAPVGLDLAIREKIKRVVMMHYDPAASDLTIHKAYQIVDKYYKNQKKQAARAGIEMFDVDWCYGYDGLEIEL